MSWLFYSFIAITFTTIYSLISKKILNDKHDHHPISYAATLFFLVGLYSLIAYGVTGFQTSDLVSLNNPTVVAVLGLELVCYTLAPSFYYRALKHLPASEVAILYSLTGVYALILGVALGTETFLVSRVGGAAVIITGIAVINWKTGHWKTNRHATMMLGATLLYAIAAMSDNFLIQNNYFSVLFLQTLSFVLPAVAILFVNPSSLGQLHKVFQKSVLPVVMLNAVFFFVYFYSIYQAYKVGGATSQVNLVLATETIVMVVLSAFFLREREHLKSKIIAGLLACIGIYLLR